MNVVRLLITLLLVAIIVLSALGVGWWGDPPKPLEGYTVGGKVILVLLILGAGAGLFRLWKPERRSA